MIKIALTGGVGMGKSSAGAYLAKHGVAVVDTDQIAREIVEPGEPALEEIHAVFGPEVFESTARLDRAALAKLVFESETERRKLEDILHPRIREVWQRRLIRLAQSGESNAVVIIPLLFEIEAQTEFDATICVACEPATQESRLAARGWSSGQIKNRIGSQMFIKDKLRLADFVVWNEGPLEVMQSQLEQIPPLAALAQDGLCKRE
jgi:dephospho-CoA kinase